MSLIIKNSNGGGVTLDSTTSANETLTLPTGGGTLADTGLTNALTTRVNAVGGRKNLIINGSHLVSQRGTYTSATSLSAAWVYYLDRFKTRINNITGTLTHKVDQAVNGEVVDTVLLTATSATSGYINSLQQVEDVQVVKTRAFTVSAWVKSNSTNAKLVTNIDNGGGVSNSPAHTGGGAWELLQVTVTATSGATAFGIYIGLLANGTGNVTIASGDYIEFTNVQLELGSAATDFEHRSYGEELLLCQRYYETQYFSALYLGTGQGSHNLRQAFFSVTKRAVPTLTTAFIIDSGTLPVVGAASVGGYRYGRISDNSVLSGFAGTLKADAEL